MAKQTKPRSTKAIVAENLTAALKAHGENAYVIAKTAGVARSYLYEVAAGTKSPTIDWLERVAKVLKIEAWELARPSKRKG